VKAEEQITTAVIRKRREVTRNVGLDCAIVRNVHPIFQLNVENLRRIFN